jgi:hypothetical protein
MKTQTCLLVLLLTASFLPVRGQNLLRDGDFESSVPDGTWPSSGYWDKSWYPTRAGAVTTTTAARAGKCGLWMYTSVGYSFSRPSQECQVKMSSKCRAEAYFRCPVNETWTKGSVAFLRITFIGSNGNLLKVVTSDTLKIHNTTWRLYAVNKPVPLGTARIQYIINLESRVGQSILNVDECSLICY